MGEPKTRGKEYFPFILLLDNGFMEINKCNILLNNNKLYINGEEVSGFLISNKNAIIQAHHYTSREKASIVRTYRAFIGVEEGTYVYFLENSFRSSSQNEIKHITGAASAEVKFNIEFIVPCERIWIKIQPGFPVKYAIADGLSCEEIFKISLEKIS